MRSLVVERVMSPSEATELVGNRAELRGNVTLVEAPARVVDAGGNTVAILAETPLEGRGLIRACHAARSCCAVGPRSRGLTSRSLTFGAMPRRTFRQDFCSHSLALKGRPTELAAFMSAGEIADRLVADVWPEAHATASDAVRSILPEWRLRDTIFTGGIYNDTTSLTLHRDKGNFPNGVSAMYVFAGDIEGGHLLLPEYHVALSFTRPSVLIFRGQDTVHGVTPIRQKTSLAYRYSVVYYALRQLCACGSLHEELDRAKLVRTNREAKRASSPPKGKIFG